VRILVALIFQREKAQGNLEFAKFKKILKLRRDDLEEVECSCKHMMLSTYEETFEREKHKFLFENQDFQKHLREIGQECSAAELSVFLIYSLV